MPGALAGHEGSTLAELCPGCRSSRWRPAFRRGGPAFRRCTACGSLFDPDPPAGERVRELYDGAEYFVKSRDDPDGGTLWGYPDDYLANRANVEDKFAQVLGHLERYVPVGRLLDVGAGPGFLLSVAVRNGWDATGVDLNEWAARHARSELGLDVRVGELGDFGFDDHAFDALTMMDVIEHLPDPEALVAEAARLVRPDGALAVLTPDAGSPLSRILGRRWPEVQRPGEHTVLFSVDGLSRLLGRHGFVACGRHSVGKTASLATLAADVTPVAPAWAQRLRAVIADTKLGGREIEFDPRTKYCLYARRVRADRRAPTHRPARIRKHPERQESVEGAILEELQSLAKARRYCDWLFAQFERHVTGDVVEVGAGIGTFTRRILARGANRVLLVEPNAQCAELLERLFGDHPRVELAREQLPDAPSLREGSHDLVVCQNVLEHVSDDVGAVQSMADTLRGRGRLALIVPAGPKLYGPLDEAYGHRRRYSRSDLEAVVRGSGLAIESLHHLNAPGILAWWLKNRRPGTRVGAGALRAYERVVRVIRPLEERFRPPVGLSLVCVAAKPSP